MTPVKRKSAYSAALQEAKAQQQQTETVTPSEVETAIEPATPEQHSPINETVQSQDLMLSDGFAVLPPEIEEELEQESKTVTPSGGRNEKEYERKEFPEKVSIYLTTAQAEKLDDLAHDYRKRHKKRINRNDIIRHLINMCDLDTLDTLQ